MTNETKTDDRVTVRIGSLKKKLKSAAKKTGQKDSEIIRVALGMFFKNHPTGESIIAGVIHYRAEEASA
jgi:hypothetical protein